MEFSQKVRLLRKKNRFTQTTFANAVGVSRQSVYKWEDGQAYPEVERLVKMRYIFNCSIDDLLDDGMSVSDDGTLKPNSVVEYENAHKKTRKPRKDKGIKTGIPPMRKNGEPVVRRKKPVEAPKEEEPAFKIPERQNSLRTRMAPAYSNRDAAAAARAAIANRRLNRPRFSDEFDDDLDFSEDVDFSDSEFGTADPRRAALDRRGEAVKVKTVVIEEPKPARVPKEKKKVASLINTEADGTQARKAAEAAAAAAEAERLQKEAEEAAAMKEAEALRKAEERKAKAAAARAAARAEKEAAQKAEEAAAAEVKEEKKPAPKKKTEPVVAKAPEAKAPAKKPAAPAAEKPAKKAEPAPAPAEEQKPEKKGGLFSFFRRK